jgi:hypothetical protein
MKYVLLLLFFSTPPAQHVDTASRKAKSVWTLQSTTTMEFSTSAACEINGQTVLDSLDDTDTLTATGWCFCESEPGFSCHESYHPEQNTPSARSRQGFSVQQYFPKGSDKAVEIGAKQLISKSFAKVIEQEKQNRSLRNKNPK